MLNSNILSFLKKKQRAADLMVHNFLSFPFSLWAKKGRIGASYGSQTFYSGRKSRSIGLCALKKQHRITGVLDYQEILFFSNGLPFSP